MFKPEISERIIHKLDMLTMGLFSPFKRRRLTNTDFTIISNNCWGGVAYEHFGIKKQSPTIGCFFMADDYLKFIANLDRYLKQELHFINIEESKHCATWSKDPGMKNVPIGALDDVEIAFLHYKNPEVALEKWNRRVERINKANLIFKFSYMNHCSENDLETFIKMPLPGKKLCFVKDDVTAKKDESLVYYRGFEHSDQVLNDTLHWDKYFDVTTFINDGIIIKK